MILYEKKYKDALRVAKSYYVKGNKFLVNILPELSEDENDKIINEFIIGLESDINDGRYETIYGIPLSKALSFFKNMIYHERTV